MLYGSNNTSITYRHGGLVSVGAPKRPCHCFLTNLLYSWATREDIPFIRPAREVPSNIKGKLPAMYVGALETQVMNLGYCITVLIRKVFTKTR